MHSRLSLILVYLLLLGIGVQAQKIAVKQTKDAEDVRAALGKLLDGFNNRDAKAVLSSFSEDVYIINPTRGAGDYKNLSEGLAKAYAVPTKNPYTVLINVEEVQASGDLAFVRLMWLRERNSDKAIISKEKDLEIWRRQKNGQWKLARGYSFYFKEDFPLTPVSALAKSERAENKQNGKKTTSNQPEDVEAVKSALDKLVASYNNRELETAMSSYAPDSLLTHEGVADTNRDETRRAYAKRFNDAPPFPIKISYQVEEIQTSGDLAFARLIWLVERNFDKEILSRNKDLEIWQRQKDGSWKLARGIGFYLKPEKANAVNSESQSNKPQKTHRY